MSKEVTVFTSQLCSYCYVAKDYLSSKGVQYIEKDVETDQEARQELMQKGITAVPVIKIEEELIVGFDKYRIDELLGL